MCKDLPYTPGFWDPLLPLLLYVHLSPTLLVPARSRLSEVSRCPWSLLSRHFHPPSTLLSLVVPFTMLVRFILLSGKLWCLPGPLAPTSPKPPSPFSHPPFSVLCRSCLHGFPETVLRLVSSSGTDIPISSSILTDTTGTLRPYPTLRRGPPSPRNRPLSCQIVSVLTSVSSPVSTSVYRTPLDTFTHHIKRN